MYNELNEVIIKVQDGRLGKLAEEVAKEIFKETKAETQEEMNEKSYLIKQAFLNKFEFDFETQFLNASEDLT